MIRVLVLTHGDLANSILESARMIDPHLVADTDAVTLPWDVDTDVARRHARFWHANATRRGKFADSCARRRARHALPS